MQKHMTEKTNCNNEKMIAKIISDQKKFPNNSHQKYCLSYSN